jgi:hypothetical protein
VNHPTDRTPRRYSSREAAESVAAAYSVMAYFSSRGKPYIYPCTMCDAHHVGLDTSRPWHGTRRRHDQHKDFAGQHPGAAVA